MMLNNDFCDFHYDFFTTNYTNFTNFLECLFEAEIIQELHTKFHKIKHPHVIRRAKPSPQVKFVVKIPSAVQFFLILNS